MTNRKFQIKLDKYEAGELNNNWNLILQQILRIQMKYLLGHVSGHEEIMECPITELNSNNARELEDRRCLIESQALEDLAQLARFEDIDQNLAEEILTDFHNKFQKYGEQALQAS